MKISTNSFTILSILTLNYLPKEGTCFVPLSRDQNSLHSYSNRESDGSSRTTSSIIPTQHSTSTSSSFLLSSSRRPRSSQTQLFMAVYPVLDDWSLVTTGGIQGTVTDSPFEELEVGEVITTSKIVTNRNSIAEGTIVETASGSRYILGSKKIMGSTSAAVAAATVIPTLKEWTLTSNGEVTGIITDYVGEDFIEGELITTSPLSSRRGVRDGAVVTTTSGSKYRLGKKKPLNVGLQERSISDAGAGGSTRPIVDKGVESSSSSSSREEELVASSSVKASSSGGKPSSSIFGGFNFFTSQEKDDIVSDVMQAVDEEEKEDKKARKRAPAPFGSVGKGLSKGVGREATTEEEVVPVLNNWFVNKREQVVGIVSNSPYANEQDGKRIVTSEVATNMAFVEEGFTVLTVDDRKYKLGVPKGGSKKNYEDEMSTYITPTLNDWDVDSALKITGTIQGSNNRNVPDGTTVTTDQVISDFEFIDEGFTICTESGMMFKLGNRKRGRKPAAATNAFELPKISLPEVSVPKISVPEFNLGGSTRSDSNNKSRSKSSGTNQKRQEEVSERTGTMTLSGKIARMPKPKIQTTKGSFFRLAGNKKPRTSSKPSSTTSSPSIIPTLQDWTVNENNQVSGIISNSIDRDGEILTTSEITIKKAALRQGLTVYTKSGSAYILGKHQRANPRLTRSKPQSFDASASVGGAVVIPVLNEWAVTAVGGLSGVVTNCPDPSVEDGEILTTSKLLNDVSTLAPGDTVETINGSKYILGSRRPSGAQVESPETPVLAGLWVMALLIFVALTD
eukprot:CAMPEP_0176489636 /NCGR_PEP_ID=MMETSP0200_2-20121128/7405_1 /TAXON_ID=947934 /ORGANISM="Chaetoceros sp., Strain GSL56" /LENGTH=791 /DNA_ID=CAMNT_0017886813 /DNA_START=290 /DNA_END=2665 /DNA_ORIENTATION=+